MTPSSTRVVLSLFAGKERLTSSEIASALGLSTRMVRVLLKKWVEDGWLIVADQSNRGRAYVLSAIYRQSDDGIGEKQRGKFQRIIRRDHGDAKITR
ncbi:MAG: hypothetical protein Q8O28_12680 [Smithellaceae bacterium]|nr:hypothetical protein [Smithellaceae bacterium]